MRLSLVNVLVAQFGSDRLVLCVEMSMATGNSQVTLIITLSTNVSRKPLPQRVLARSYGWEDRNKDLLPRIHGNYIQFATISKPQLSMEPTIHREVNPRYSLGHVARQEYSCVCDLFWFTKAIKWMTPSHIAFRLGILRHRGYHRSAGD